MITVITPTSKQFYTQDTILSVFLAGSIEQGKAEDWQQYAIRKFTEAGIDITVFNPRRDNWSELDQENLEYQIKWELEHLDAADVIMMNFIPGTMSPISLLEFGLHLKSNKLHYHCPKGYWRKDNVDITNHFYYGHNENSSDSLDELIDRIIDFAKTRKKMAEALREITIRGEFVNSLQNASIHAKL